MNIDSMPYCVSTACAQPAGTGAAGKSKPIRLDSSTPVHHAIDTNTADAPAKNSKRCGAAASKRGNGAGAGKPAGAPPPPLRVPAAPANVAAPRMRGSDSTRSDMIECRFGCGEHGTLGRDPQAQHE